MHLKKIIVLSVVFYTAVYASFRIANEKWRAASPDSFIAQETVPASSDITCASIASSKSWVNLYKYEDNTCQLSAENRLPTSEPQHDSYVKSKFSPDDCLLLNGSVVRNGRQAELTDCATYICEHNEWVMLTERNYASSCVSPFITYNGGCYHYSSTPKTWCDARKDCWSMGADLINAYGWSMDAIANIYDIYGANNPWLGIKRESRDVGFVYLSTPGQPSLSSSSAHWKTPDPDDLEESTCVCFYSLTSQIVDTDCLSTRNYLCEIP